MYKTKIPEIKSQRALNEGKVNMAFMPYCSIPGEIEGLSIEVSICPFPSGTLFRFCDIDSSDDSVDIISTSYQFVPGTMMVACTDRTDTDIHLYDEAGFSVKSLRILFDEDEAQWRPLSTKNIDKEEVEEDDGTTEEKDDENTQEEEFVDNSVEVIEPEQVPEQEEPEPENDDEDDEDQEPEPEPTKEDKPHIRSIGARQETSRKEPMRREEPERKPERQKDDRRERQERRDNKGFNGTQSQRQPQQNQRQRFDQRQKGNVQERQQSQQQQQPRRDNRPQEQQPRRDSNGGKGNRNDNRQQQQQRRTANVSKPSFDFSGIVKQAYSN